MWSTRRKRTRIPKHIIARRTTSLWILRIFTERGRKIKLGGVRKKKKKRGKKQYEVIKHNDGVKLESCQAGGRERRRKKGGEGKLPPAKLRGGSL